MILQVYQKLALKLTDWGKFVTFSLIKVGHLVPLIVRENQLFIKFTERKVTVAKCLEKYLLVKMAEPNIKVNKQN